MKKILSILVITVLLANAANADQRKGNKGPDIDQIVSTLQLDASTSTNLKALMEKHHEERKAARAEVKEAKKAAHEEKKKEREAKKTARKQHRADLLAILGYEKLYEFEDIMQANRKGKDKDKRRSKE